MIKLKEDDVDEPGVFVRDNKNNENLEIQPDVQPITVEEKPAVCAAFCKLQTFFNDTKSSTTTP